jgi:hypothetical protein
MLLMPIFYKKMNYKYIIDTSSVLSQKAGREHRKNVYVKLWKNIAKLIELQEIVICSEIEEEIKDKELKEWLKVNKCIVINVDENIQNFVTKIVSKHPKLIDFNNCTSSGDAFLIATAYIFKLTIITEENKKSLNKIPQIAQSMGVKTINLVELCDLKKWTF